MNRNNDYYFGKTLKLSIFLLLICITSACTKKSTDVATVPPVGNDNTNNNISGNVVVRKATTFQPSISSLI